MAVYTIELGKLIQSGYDIGLNDYPVPSYLNEDLTITYPDGAVMFIRAEMRKEEFRKALNKKITDHYMFDEICCTAPDRFKQLLNNTMREIMPVKNLLYDALAENWKFYTGSSFTEAINDTRNDTHDGSHTGTDATARTGNDKLARSGVDTVGNISNTTSSNNGYVLNVGSDTPGQMLNIETDIANNTYASNANKYKSTSSSNGNSTSTDTTTYNSTDTTTHNTTDTTTYDTKTKATNAGTYERQRTVTGLNGKSYAELFKEYQGSLRNIDMEVIRALGMCFMSVF